MAERLRVALIGCGTWGKNLLRAIAEQPDVEVTCVIDSDPRALAAAHEVTPDAGLDVSIEALDKLHANAVLIATPGPLHARHALRAIESGAHIFVEKPMTTTLADAARVVEAADRRGLIGMVGHVLRYHPAVHAAVELVRAGELGRPLHLRSERCALAGSRDVDGSVLWSLAPHDLSILRAIDASAISSVSVESRRRGLIATLELRTASGLRANVLVSRASDRKIRRTVIECERGRVELDDVVASNKVSVWRDGESGPRWLEYTEREPLREEIAAFVRCVRLGEQPPTSLAEGLAVVSVLAQAAGMIESARSSPPVFAER
jgi:predicted dehydrogenase